MANSKLPMSLLDIFILYLVRDGVNTLYRLKNEGGISIGAASPSLRRLEKEWICRQKTFRKGKEIRDVRGKHEYRLNVMALSIFQSDWLAQLEADLPTDIESVARLVALAEFENRPDVARKALINAIKERRKRALRPVPTAGRSARASRYRAILHDCETVRLKAEAAALKKILAGQK